VAGTLTEMPPRSRVLGAVIGFAFATVACAPESVTDEGRDVNRLYDFFSIAAAVIFVITAGLIAWSIIRYRARSDDDEGRPFHSNVPLEIVWFAIPQVIVIALFIASTGTLDTVDRKVPDPGVTISVEGFQWGWRFRYEEGVVISGDAQDPAEIVVPVDEPISFEITSVDVIHSFYVTKFLLKRDAIPGRTTRFDITIDSPGVYEGKCAEFCGLLHSRMNFTIRAVERSVFEGWLSEQPRS
jgi:cytochrome c oxidase subunit 2